MRFLASIQRRERVLALFVMFALALACLAPGVVFAYMDNLATLDNTRSSRSVSSYDRAGGNKDNTGYLYSDATGKVMFDARGPGRVNSIWCTGFDANTRFKFYFDGESNPRIDIRVGDLFSGAYTGYNNQFRAPLVGNNLAYSGGFVCYVPLPFAQSLKISTDATNISYHNIHYDIYPAGTSIASWTQNQDNSAQIAAWNNPTVDPKSNGTITTVSNFFTVSNGTSTTLINNLAGPRSIVSLKLRIPSLTPNILNTTRLQITWDNAAQRAFDVPIGLFFGTGSFGVSSVRALPLGYDTGSNTLYMYLPMPFASQARIALQNNTGATLSNVWYEVQHKSVSSDFTNVGNLKGAYTFQSHDSNDHSDLLFLSVAGSGRFVGIVDSRSRFLEWPWGVNYLEGDERITVDNSATPSWHGTGTEDFYNGGWYFDQGTYTRPPSGCTVRDLPPPDTWNVWTHMAMYRTLVEDTVPFRRYLSVSMEHGFGWGDGTSFEGDIAVTAEALAFYYHKPAIRMILADTLDVGNASSESGHSYTVSGQTFSGSRAFTYEGDNDETSVTDDGRAFTGASQFVLRNLPASNQGVVLRRRLDYGILNQQADVTVDGVLVGRWYTAGNNLTHRWRDSDYMIPAARTNGKTQITVKIQFVAPGNPDWNEFRYEAYSLN